MSESIETTPVVKLENPPAGSGQTPVTPPEGDPGTPSNIPYARFKEILDAKKELETKLAKVKDDQDKARKDDLEKKGEYKKLLDEQSQLLTAFKTKADQYDAYIESRKTELLEKLPEDKRAKFQSASLELLEETVKLITIANPISTNRALGGVFGGYKSLMEATEAKMKGKLTDEQFGQIRSQFLSAAYTSHNR